MKYFGIFKDEWLLESLGVIGKFGIVQDRHSAIIAE